MSEPGYEATSFEPELGSSQETPARETPPVGDAPQTYETAAARVEEIIRRLDSGDAGLRETLDLVAEGRELVEYCAGELEAVSKGLEELRLDELVTRLEAR
jgi:exodeoxyribonuclease VII small subunit